MITHSKHDTQKLQAFLSTNPPSSQTHHECNEQFARIHKESVAGQQTARMRAMLLTIKYEFFYNSDKAMEDILRYMDSRHKSLYIMGSENAQEGISSSTDPNIHTLVCYPFPL